MHGSHRGTMAGYGAMVHRAMYADLPDDAHIAEAHCRRVLGSGTLIELFSSFVGVSPGIFRTGTRILLGRLSPRDTLSNDVGTPPAGRR